VVTQGICFKAWEAYAPTLTIRGLSHIPEWFQPKPSFVAAIAQAMLLGAKEITMHGCDMAGRGHCVHVPAMDSWCEEEWEERWETERLILDEWRSRAAAKGVKIHATG